MGNPSTDVNPLANNPFYASLFNLNTQTPQPFQPGTPSPTNPVSSPFGTTPNNPYTANVAPGATPGAANLNAGGFIVPNAVPDPALGGTTLPAGTPGSAPGAGITNPFTTGLPMSQVDTYINNLITQAGVQNTDNGAYWQQQWSAWGNADPNGFYQRLTQGIAGQPGYNGLYGPGGSSGGGSGGAGVGGNTGAVDLTGAISGLTGKIGSTPQAAQEQSLFDILYGLANTSQNVNAQDPLIKNASDAYAASQERQLRNDESSAAESMGPNANTSAVNRSLSENAAQNTGAFTAAQVVNELANRRQMIQQALSTGAGLLGQEQSLNLQEELAQLDAQISQAQLQQGAYQYDTSLQSSLVSAA